MLFTVVFNCGDREKEMQVLVQTRTVGVGRWRHRKKAQAHCCVIRERKRFLSNSSAEQQHRKSYSGTSLWRTPLGPSWLSCIQWNLSMVDIIGTQLAVLYTVEPLYGGHHWDPAGCPVYSGTSLWWRSLGPSWLSCIERCP